VRSDPPAARRPLKTRSTAWAQALARLLVRSGCSPNLISLASVVFALGGAAALAWIHRVPSGWPSALLALAAIAGIQLRLLCNLLDGMVAVEGGRGGPTGELYNELPDRIADVALIAVLALPAAQSPWPLPTTAAWLAATLAVLTAYLRALGVQAGAPAAFHGPMAKPHRMFLLSVACVVAAAWPPGIGAVFHATLWLMIAGMLLTLIRRLRAIAGALRAEETRSA